MLTRRHFISTATGALAAGAAPLAAQEEGGLASLPPEMAPRYVTLDRPVPPGEIHIVPDTYKLFWTLPDRQAIRYFVGVGRDNLYVSGVFRVGAKKEWPSWTPTDDMIAREPEKYAQHADGMPGGPDNPLGARALYLFEPEGGDTFLRIHGTSEPHTIGHDVSNGCARLVNRQMVDLYDRVPVGAKVYLYEKDILPPLEVS